MKHIVLSAVTLAAMSTMASADDSAELAALKKQMAAMMKKIEVLESKQAKQDKAVKHVAQQQVKAEKKVEEISVAKGTTVINSKVPVIEMSGTHYLGFVNHSNDTDSASRFETRRNYFQAKAYFAENPKDYFRITMDTFQNTTSNPAIDTESSLGSWEVRIKYAYLYLDSILPYTGVEIGQAHRPWIDYEEHHGWWYRSISHVLVESPDAANFTNSADIGVNFQTKTDYFSSELGLFNGEGYHGALDNNNNKLSGEWRLTAHLLGTGKNKEKRDETYANVSFFGQHNVDVGNSRGNPDFDWYGFHAVYNQPEFLLAAQYVATTEAGAGYEGDGWSINGEYRFMPSWNLLARYDNYELDTGIDKKRTIAGVAYEYNKNVEFIANLLRTDISSAKSGVDDAFMLTAEINW